MSEADWLAATDPAPMLEYWQGWLGDRKLALFAAACCRQIWWLIDDEPCRACVATAKRFADGQADVKELYMARGPTIPAERDFGPAARAAYYAANARPVDTVWHVHTAAAEAQARAATAAVTRDWDAAWNAAYGAALRAQADLLREIVGNPWQPVAVDPAWLTWSGGTVRWIARQIYDDRRFEELPVLADALEDAGCDGARLLTHCRSGGEHVRGCWAVDRLLGRA